MSYTIACIRSGSQGCEGELGHKQESSDESHAFVILAYSIISPEFKSPLK